MKFNGLWNQTYDWMLSFGAKFEKKYDIENHNLFVQYEYIKIITI